MERGGPFWGEGEERGEGGSPGWWWWRASKKLSGDRRAPPSPPGPEPPTRSGSGRSGPGRIARGGAEAARALPKPIEQARGARRWRERSVDRKRLSCGAAASLTLKEDETPAPHLLSKEALHRH